jgi:Flagellar L-ring protein
MERQLSRIVASIVVTALVTVASASASESQRLKVGDRLTVFVGETKPVNYRITAAVVSIQRNGVLVLEAHKSICFDHYLSVYKLSGNVDPKSIAANGSVLSENIADLAISKFLIDLNDCIGPF